MYTRFEEFAASSMMGSSASPPRLQGKLTFQHDWERSTFGMAIALSKQGVFEWEEFRQQLIAVIGEWQDDACKGQPTWDYYECFLAALERVLKAHGLELRESDVAELIETTPATDL